MTTSDAGTTHLLRSMSDVPENRVAKFKSGATSGEMKSRLVTRTPMATQKLTMLVKKVQ